MDERTRGRLRAIGALALGLGLVGLLLYRNRADLGRLLEHPPRVSWVLTALVVTFVGVYSTFVRWYALVRAQGLPFPFVDAQRLGFVGFLFNQVIPGAVSGDLVKLGLFAREQEKLGLGMATIVVDRIVGMYGLFLVGSLAVLVFSARLFLTATLRSAAALVLAAALGSTVVLAGLILAASLPRLGELARRAPLVGRSLAEMIDALGVYRGKYLTVLAAIGLACFGHGCFITALYCCARALPGPMWPLSVHCVATPIGLTINALPLTSGGIGVGEAAMQEIFRLLGHDGAKAFLMMLTYRLLCWIVALGGVPYLVRSARARRRLSRPA